MDRAPILVLGSLLVGCGGPPVGESAPPPASAPAEAPAAKPPPLLDAAESWSDPWANSLGMRFRRIEPGEFRYPLPMRDPVDSAREAFERRQLGQPMPEVREKTVRLTRDYFIGVCEVSEAEFRKVLGRAPAHDVGDSRPTRGPERPAASVTWEEAEEFCRRLSERQEEVDAGRKYRLPSDIEWYRAANASGERDPCFPWKSTVLHFTVREWTAVPFNEAYYDSMPEVDPPGPSSGEGHLSWVSWTHPDPHSGSVYTFRVVAERR